MKFLNIIKGAYITYTIYALLIIDVTSLKLIDILPALFIMWLMYIFFILGFKINSRPKWSSYINRIKTSTSKILNKLKLKLFIKSIILFTTSIFTLVSSFIITLKNRTSWILKKPKLTLFLIAMGTLITSVLSAWFYTGKTPVGVFIGLFGSGTPLYADYQLYSQVNNLAVFTIQKIPFILMMFYTKIVLFYSLILFFIIKDKTNIFEKSCLFLIVSSHIYFGIARGTNYELFEIVLLIIFIILSKSKIKLKNKPAFLKYFLIVFSIGMMIFLFYIRISARGFIFDYKINSDFTYNSNGIVSLISPYISSVIILLYNYFGFGFYYVSNFVIKIWFASLSNFISGLIPFGYYLQNHSYIQELIRNHLVMNGRWHPDIINAINYFGIIGVIILLFILGILTRIIMKQKKSALLYLTQFIIFMQMISLPVGNFLLASSSSKLIVMLIVFLWIWKLLIKNKFKFKNLNITNSISDRRV